MEETEAPGKTRWQERRFLNRYAPAPQSLKMCRLPLEIFSPSFSYKRDKDGDRWWWWFNGAFSFFFFLFFFDLKIIKIFFSFWLFLIFFFFLILFDFLLFFLSHLLRLFSIFNIIKIFFLKSCARPFLKNFEKKHVFLSSWWHIFFFLSR